MAGEEMAATIVRSTYLLTYSRVDLTRFPTRRSFADIVVGAFPDSDRNKLLQWACSAEEHADGHPHYHMCLKFNANRRWRRGKNRIFQNHGISVHFSSFHNDYPDAFTYVTKHDAHYITSENHPPLMTPHRTRNASVAARKRTRETARGNEDEQEGKNEKEEKKTKRLSAGLVADFAVKHNIRTEKDMHEAIKLQKNEGQMELHDFVLGKPRKVITDIITRAWDIENSLSGKERRSKSLITILAEASEGECVNGCNGRWLELANETLTNNRINPYVFADAIRVALKEGRGKGFNVMIKGKGNCAKTFILLPLTSIYKAFSNPASTTFAWIGVEEKELIFLNDFRWNPTVLDWSALLNLLDGIDVNLPRPKTIYSTDITLSRGDKVPIFCTTIDRIKYVGPSEHPDEETNMMDLRWKVFEFTHVIPPSQAVKIEPCGKCFANMAMLGSQFDD
jgi:hypothetical protein